MDEPLQLFGRRFEVMSTGAEVMVWSNDRDGTAEAFDDVERELHRLSARLTRFDPASDMERLNDAGGGTLDAELREILEAALDAWHETAGRFDVGLGAELIAEGYDRDFDELEAVDARTLWVPADGGADGNGHEPDRTVLVAPPFSIDGSTLRIRPGCRLDLGGFAKGWAADHVRDVLGTVGPCLVNIGGDIAISPADGVEPWTIGLDVDGVAATYDLSFGGVATSGQDVRAWRTDGSGAYAHHIIDPATRSSAASDILRVSVFADSCSRAEAWTKALLIAGFETAVAEAEQRGLAAILTAMDGTTARTGAARQM